MSLFRFAETMLAGARARNMGSAPAFREVEREASDTPECSLRLKMRRQLIFPSASSRFFLLTLTACRAFGSRAHRNTPGYFDSFLADAEHNSLTQ